MAEVFPLRRQIPFEVIRQNYDEANRHFEAVCRCYDARCPSSVDRFRTAQRLREQALAAYLEAIRREAHA